MLAYFIDRILPGLITSAVAVFVFNGIQAKMIRRDNQKIADAQTRELKQHLDQSGTGTGSGDDGSGGSTPGQD